MIIERADEWNSGWDPPKAFDPLRHCLPPGESERQPAAVALGGSSTRSVVSSMVLTFSTRLLCLLKSVPNSVIVS